MISQLTGKIISTNPPEIVLEVNGVGYEVLCPLNTFYQLKTDEHKLFTQLIVRQDSQTLYGFNHLDEKTLFNALIKVSGVGAKAALAILSTLSVADVLACVADDGVELLQQTPGIGKKTAQKMIVELKDRLPKLNLIGVDTKPTQATITPNNKAFNAALSALSSLGFKPKEAKAMLKEADNSLSTEELIRFALQGR